MKNHQKQHPSDWRKLLQFDYFLFITSLNETIKGKPLSVDCEKSPIIHEIATLLAKIEEWIDQHVPTTLSLRGRSEAFKMWHARLKNEANRLLSEALPEEFCNSVMEIVVYFMESFGSPVHFNYGPRHEMSFGLFLCCLIRIGALTAKDQEGIITVVFVSYIKVIHKLQTTYGLRYARRHGVWRLDDPMYLPYIWGSSQLIGHPHVYPSSIIESECVDTYSQDYMFLACVKHINEIRGSSIAEHSIQLWNLSGVPSWPKINEHLLNIRYREDVLGKFQIVHQTLVGSLMTMQPCAREPEWLFKFF
ncbi:serine/threonine-protein phosphatase 2A activator-like isoform X2 [Schistocerca gregaria]|uniref:serine/threonine-protein phosphatase 2A activator-like isoform X2 n=1 Tax=Schistocerca gregaria TaxID=7010 RepID=UPI00211E20A0|nr:serine/threonine-protein phosphatase 2A activator-like isoform X2 [Schistocerca gregaria]